MKRIILISAGLALTLVTGCIVTSVYPFYHEKDIVFEPALLGSWQKAGQSDEHWTFARDKANGYLVSCVSKDTTNVFQGYVFKLHREKFLDLSTVQWKEDIQPEPVPSHLLVRIGQFAPSLKLANLKYDWLGELVAKNPKAIRHILIKTGDKPEDRRVVLTADTAELQRFVIKHLKTKDAWDDSVELQPAATEPRSR
jgi:hypothetical protein